MTPNEKIADRNTNIALELGNVLKEINGYDFDLDIRNELILVTVIQKGTEKKSIIEFKIL